MNKLPIIAETLNVHFIKTWPLQFIGQQATTGLENI